VQNVDAMLLAVGCYRYVQPTSETTIWSSFYAETLTCTPQNWKLSTADFVTIRRYAVIADDETILRAESTLMRYDETVSKLSCPIRLWRKR
jgi:hypothetical protein